MKKKSDSEFEQPIYTAEMRLGECILLLCGRDPSAASAIAQALERSQLSNGAQIIEMRLKTLHDTVQRGLPIIGQVKGGT